MLCLEAPDAVGPKLAPSHPRKHVRKGQASAARKGPDLQPRVRSLCENWPVKRTKWVSLVHPCLAVMRVQGLKPPRVAFLAWHVRRFLVPHSGCFSSSDLVFTDGRQTPRK